MQRKYTVERASLNIQISEDFELASRREISMKKIERKREEKTNKIKKYQKPIIRCGKNVKKCTPETCLNVFLVHVFRHFDIFF